MNNYFNEKMRESLNKWLITANLEADPEKIYDKLYDGFLFPCLFIDKEMKYEYDKTNGYQVVGGFTMDYLPVKYSYDKGAAFPLTGINDEHTAKIIINNIIDAAVLDIVPDLSKMHLKTITEAPGIQTLKGYVDACDIKDIMEEQAECWKPEHTHLFISNTIEFDDKAEKLIKEFKEKYNEVRCVPNDVLNGVNFVAVESSAIAQHTRITIKVTTPDINPDDDGYKFAYRIQSGIQVVPDKVSGVIVSRR